MEALALAATVILVREREGRLEVFLVRRSQRSGYLPHVWVFPGGRLDESDGAVAVPVEDGFGWTPEVAGALRVCAARETFEEAGIWLGDGEMPAELRAPLASGAVPIGEVLAAHGATLDPSRLRPWARWQTPVGEGRRFDAAFFLVESDADGAHDAEETVDSGWFSPADVIAGGFVAFPLAPPTFCGVSELAAAGSLAALKGLDRDLRPVQPVRHVGEGQLVMALPGDPLHAEPARAYLPTRLRYEPDQWRAEWPA